MNFNTFRLLGVLRCHQKLFLFLTRFKTKYGTRTHRSIPPTGLSNAHFGLWLSKAYNQSQLIHRYAGGAILKSETIRSFAVQKKKTEKSHYSHFIMQECSLRSRFRRLETDDIAANILCGDARSADATNKNAWIALVDNIKRFRTVLRSILHRSFQRRMHELVHCVWRMCSIGT